MPKVPRPHRSVVFGDPWPEEPDDPFGDPGASQTGDTTSIATDGEVPRELFRAFWGLVAVFNLGLFATALGVLLLVFRDVMVLGVSLLTLGLASLAFGVHRYQLHRAAGVAGADPGEGDEAVEPEG